MNRDILIWFLSKKKKHSLFSGRRGGGWKKKSHVITTGDVINVEEVVTPSATPGITNVTIAPFLFWE